MRFKFGVVIGLTVGYVLGTKAGRQRYEQIKRSVGRLRGSPAVQRATERASVLAGEKAKHALYAVQSGVEKAGSAVKERLAHDQDPTSEIKERMAGPESSGAEPGTTPANARDAWQA